VINWVDIKDKLPEINEVVLIRHSYTFAFAHIDSIEKYEKGEDYVLWYEDCLSYWCSDTNFDGDEITYWAPISELAFNPSPKLPTDSPDDAAHT